MNKEMSNQHNLTELSNIEPEDLLQLFGLSEPPFDPFYIIEKLGVNFDERYEQELMELSGEITYKNGETTIWINPFEYKLRRNFTAAHEIGHYIKHILPEIIKGKKEEIIIKEPRKNGHTNYKEIEANDFAARLLMPKSAIVVQIRKMLVGKHDNKIEASEAIKKLSDIFQVSEPAVENRLKNLKIL